MSYTITPSQALKTAAHLGLCTILIKSAAFIKSSYILGSQILFFSGSSIAVPLMGTFNGPLTCTALFIIRLALLGFSGFHTLAFIIPGFCAALYWSMNHWSIRLLTPITCFIAFIAHPVGAQAYTYALYWLLPIGLYFVPHKNLFLTALASTFVAHAVGSTIWIYTVPMTADMWIGLIPLVAIERLCFATGMVISHQAVHAVTGFMREKYKSMAIFYHTYRS